MGRVIEIVKERKFKYICFFWIIISLQFVIGSNLQTKGYSIQGFQDAVISILKVIFLSVIFIILHYSIMKLIEKIKKDKEHEELKEKSKKYNWLKYFLIIFVCWIPTLLAFYPAIISYDGGYQIRNCVFFGKIGTGNPILYTALLTFFYKLGAYGINSPNTGMFLFSIFQALVMSLIFSYSVKFIEEESNNKWLKNATLIFYALFPYNQLFPIITTKDVLFAGFVILFIINLYSILKKQRKIADYIYFIILTVLMLLFRGNAIYAFVALIPFIILIKDKKICIKLLSMFFIIIVLYQISNNVLIYLINEEKGENRAQLCVWSQAVGKICNEKQEELTEEEKEKISFYFEDYKEIGQVYKSNIADNTANMINCENTYSNKADFLKFMIQLGIKYPREFIDSFLNTIRGYWYICDNSFNTIWHNERPYTMGALELYCLPIGIGKYAVLEESKIPKLKEFYQVMFCQNKYEEIPVLYILFQPATYFYILIAYILYSIYKRDKVGLLIGIYLFLYFLTCFLGPCSIIRYIYAVIVCVPIMACIVAKNEQKGEKET